MKTLTLRNLLAAAVTCGSLAILSSAQAADVIKADNADNLTSTTSWLLGTVPTDADVAVWNNTVLAGYTTLLENNTNWAGIRIADPAGAPIINSTSTNTALGATLTLGASGIDLSAATQNLTINAPVSNLVAQTWSVGSGRSLTLNGALTGDGRLTKVGPGTLFVSSVNGAFAGGFTLTEATTQTGNSGNATTMFGTNTMVLTNGARVRFQSTSSSTFNVPLQVDAGGGILSYRGNSFYGSPPISGGGTLTFQLDNGITITPSSFQNWTGTVAVVTTGTGGNFRFATAFVNSSLTNAVVNLGAGIGMNRQSASGATVEVGTLIGAVGSSVNGNAVRVGWRNEDSTFAGAVTGANGITKVGSGIWTLSANSTFAGVARIEGGKLLAITGGSFSNSTMTVVSNGATFGIQLGSAGGRWSVGTNLVFAPVSGATNALEFNFVGFPASTVTAPLQVRGNITNEGPVNVSIKGGGWAIGTYPLISFSGASGGLGLSGYVLTNLPNRVLGYLTNDTANTLSLVVTNSGLPLHWAVGNGNWDIATTANWNENGGGSTTYQEAGGIGDSVQLDDTASGASPITVSVAANVSPAGVTVDNSSKSYILAGASAISGGTPLTKLGSGTLTIQNNNNFTGGLNLNAGTVEFTANENLGASSSPVSFGGGTLRYASGSSADFSTRTVTFAAGGATINDNGNTVTLSRPVGNNGAGGLTKTGAGSLTLTGTNRYSGLTTVANGTLALAANTYISNSSAINLASSATLSGTVALSTPASQLLYGTGTLVGDLTVPTATRVSPATNGTVGVLTNTGNFTMSGGTLSMDVSTTSRDEIVVSGNVNFTAGTLALNFGNALTNGSYRLFQCASVTPGSAANLVISSAGVAQPNKALALSEAVAGEINLVVSTFRGSNIVWVGDSSLNYWDVETSPNWTNIALGTTELFVSGDKVTFNDIGSFSPDVSLQALVQPGSVTVNSANNYVFSAPGSGKIGGTAGLTKAGTGTLTITTENNNTGGTLVSGGVLQVGNGAGGDIGPGPITNNALIVFNQGTDHSAPVISGTGSIEHQGGSLLTMAAANTYAGATTIGASSRLQVGTGGATGALGSGPVTNNGVLILNRSGSVNLANGISGSGTAQLHLTGPAAVTLSGVNTYEGNTYISNGVVNLGASEVIPNGGATTGWLILDGGATTAGALNLNGFNETVNALAGLGGTVVGRITNSAASGTNTLAINQTVATTYAGLTSDNPTGAKVALDFDGGGALTLTSGSSTYSGGTLMRSGTLNVSFAGAGTGGITLSNATILNLNNTTPSTFLGNTVLVGEGADVQINSASLAAGYGGMFVSGDTNSIARIGANVSVSSSLLRQFENFTGTVVVTTGGGLRFSATALTNNGGPNTLFQVDGGMNTRNGTGGGPGVFLGALTGTGTIGGPQTPPGNSTYVIGSKGVDSIFSGTFGGDVAGSANTLVKVGAANLTLSGILTHAGSTTVSNGTLIISGTAELTNSPTINVRGVSTLDMTGAVGGGLALGTHVAQTLNGAGTILGTLSVGANSTLQPGDGVGTLTVSGAATLGGITRMQLNTTNSPATNDMLAAASITAGGTLIVTNTGPDLTSGQYFKLFSQPVLGTFTAISLPASNDLNTVSYTWQTNLAVDGSVTLLSATPVVTVNPNPTNIVATFTTTDVTLAWPTSHIGWTLQVQTNARSVGLTIASNTWYDVAGSSATNLVTIPTSKADPTVFYRLRLPQP